MIKIEHDWEYIHNHLEDMKKEFREKNGTDDILASGRKDRFYDEYCESLEKFLDSVKLDDIPKDYRIPEAKRRREKGISPWD